MLWCFTFFCVFFFVCALCCSNLLFVHVCILSPTEKRSNNKKQNKKTEKISVLPSPGKHKKYVTPY